MSSNYWQCSRSTRNGFCKGKPVRHNVGPKSLNLCRRHGRKYDEEHENLVVRTRTQHEEGHHGEGDDRRAFIGATVGEHYITCGLCQDELAADDLGVKPEQVALAQRAKQDMDEAIKAETVQITSFTSRFEKNPHEALNPAWGYVEDAQEAMRLADLWRDVRSVAEGDGTYDYKKGEYIKFNLAEAYLLKCERLINDLIANQVDQEDRVAVRKFMTTYRRQKEGML